MRWQDYIELRPEVLRGKPVFKGTRLAVEMILRERGAGSTEAELLKAYPTLRPEHLSAAYQYAAKLIGMDETVLVGSDVA